MRARGFVSEVVPRGAGFAGPRLQRRVASRQFQNRTVVAMRPTGLGSRLGEMLNALRVSSSLGAQFAFTWPPAERHPEIRTAAETFDAEFVKNHLWGESAVEQHLELRTAVGPRDIWRVSRAQSPIRMRERYELDWRVGVPLEPSTSAFRRLQFHPSIEEVRDALHDRGRFEVAVHVRRGDSLAPDVRMGGRFALKSLPLPLLREAVHRTAADLPGTSIVIVGNESSIVKGLADECSSVVTVESLGLASDDQARALFVDFLALANSRRTLAGSSAFSRVAAIAGGSHQASIFDLIRVEQVRTLLQSFVTHGDKAEDPIEIGLAADYFFKILPPGPRERDLRAEIELLDQVIAVDASDPTRWLAAISRCSLLGEPTEVSARVRAFREHFDSDSAAQVSLALRCVQPSGHWTRLDQERIAGLRDLMDLLDAAGAPVGRMPH